jgi:hypothetical protein
VRERDYVFQKENTKIEVLNFTEYQFIFHDSKRKSFRSLQTKQRTFAVTLMLSDYLIENGDDCYYA